MMKISGKSIRRKLVVLAVEFYPAIPMGCVNPRTAELLRYAVWWILLHIIMAVRQKLVNADTCYLSNC